MYFVSNLAFRTPAGGCEAEIHKQSYAQQSQQETGEHFI